MSKLTQAAISALGLGFSLIAFGASAHEHAHHDRVDYTAQLIAATPAKNLTVEQCWIRLLPSHLPSAGYFVIHNHSDQAVEVLAAATPSYDEVMLHETVEEDGMTKMQMADSLSVAAKSSLSFKPGGLHAMFEQPTGELKVGDTMPMELLFSGEQKLSVNCKVNAAKARAFDS